MPRSALPRRAAGVSPAKGAVEQSIDLTFGFLFIAVLVLAGLWLSSGILQIEAGSRAVVLRFGAFNRTGDAGLVFAWPKPFEEIIRVPGPDLQQTLDVTELDIDNRSTQTVSMSDGLNPRTESYVLTADHADQGILHLRGTLTYRVTGPMAYVLAKDHLAQALNRLFATVAVAACAGRDLDQVIVAAPQPGAGDRNAQRREQLRGDIKDAINKRIAELDLGVEISRVDYTAFLPLRAKPAFDEVLSAESVALANISSAKTDAAAKTARTTENCNRKLQDATASAKETVSRARKLTNTINRFMDETNPDRRAWLIMQQYRTQIGEIIKKAGSVVLTERDKPVQIIIAEDRSDQLGENEDKNSKGGGTRLTDRTTPVTGNAAAGLP